MPVGVITGGSGFLGSHLLARLAAASYPESTEDPESLGWQGSAVLRNSGDGITGRVEPRGCGVPRTPATRKSARLAASHETGATEVEVVAVGRNGPSGWTGRFERADLADRDEVARLMTDLRPSVVWHLAGRTPPARPDEFYQANTLATVHLLDALRSLGQPVRVILAGSAGELGPVLDADLPVGEDWPCRPVDPYGLSKHLASAAGLAAREPLSVVVARIFNPIGPGLPVSQALGRFARTLADGSGPLTLTVGDLAARRDFVDARDVADALLALAERGDPGRVYHVGTGQSHRVGDGLDRLIALSGRPVTIAVDPSFPRPTGPTDSRTDITRIKAEVGWSPRITWEQSLADLWTSVARR